MDLSNFSYDPIDKAVASLTERLYDNAKKCFALKNIWLNLAQKGLKVKDGLIKIVKLLRKRSWQLQKPSRDILKTLLCEGSNISSRRTISV